MKHNKNNNIFRRHADRESKISELIEVHETLLFSLQNFSFVINLQKSQLALVNEIEFLGLIINSWLMTLALPQDKVLDIQNKCAQ